MRIPDATQALEPWLAATDRARPGGLGAVAVLNSAVTGVFCVTYLVIASRQLHWIGLDRPAGAVVGAVAMVMVGGLPMDAALRAIDLRT